MAVADPSAAQPQVESHANGSVFIIVVYATAIFDKMIIVGTGAILLIGMVHLARFS